MDHTTSSLLCNAQELRDLLAALGAASPALRVVEIRFAPSGTSAREKYDAGHIPGAIFCDLERDLSHGQRGGAGGRHPMTSAEELAQVLSRMGIAEETEVIAYDDGPGAIAARLWFQLRLHGHRRVRLLDGGLAAWTKEGFPLETAEPHVPPAPRRKLVRDDSQLVDRAAISALVASRNDIASGKDSDAARPLLVDVRAAERYRGDLEPIDPIPGHIPGAVNLPFARFLRAADDPRWRSPDEVKSILAALGAGEREIIASCGSGVTACHLLAALEYSGSPPGKLYGGSYSDWVSDPAAEVSRGGEP